MIYTTYFANLKYLPETVTPIAICAGVPKFYKGLTYKKIAPKYYILSLWKKNHDDCFYVENFKRFVLDKLNPRSVVDELFSMVSTNDIALVCYEKPSDFCHRHLVAAWLRQAGYDCEEFMNKKERKVYRLEDNSRMR